VIVSAGITPVPPAVIGSVGVTLPTVALPEDNTFWRSIALRTAVVLIAGGIVMAISKVAAKAERDNAARIIKIASDFFIFFQIGRLNSTGYHIFSVNQALFLWADECYSPILTILKPSPVL